VFRWIVCRSQEQREADRVRQELDQLVTKMRLGNLVDRNPVVSLIRIKKNQTALGQCMLYKTVTTTISTTTNTAAKTVKTTIQNFVQGLITSEQ